MNFQLQIKIIYNCSYFILNFFLKLFKQFNFYFKGASSQSLEWLEALESNCFNLLFLPWTNLWNNFQDSRNPFFFFFPGTISWCSLQPMRSRCWDPSSSRIGSGLGDYLFRFLCGVKKQSVFSTSLEGSTTLRSAAIPAQLLMPSTGDISEEVGQGLGGLWFANSYDSMSVMDR